MLLHFCIKHITGIGGTYIILVGAVQCQQDDPFFSRNTYISALIIKTRYSQQILYVYILCTYVRRTGLEGLLSAGANIMYTHTAVICGGHRSIFYTCCAARENIYPVLKLNYYLQLYYLVTAHEHFVILRLKQHLC